MKNILSIVFVFLGLQSLAAQDLDSYKYILIPEEYDFLQEPNQYQLNELTKFLFIKSGFDAYLEGEELPEDLPANPCTGLTADVQKEQGLFVTKLYVILINCNNETVYTSAIGSSREKDYKTSYHAALRDAFKSIEALNYTYAPGAAASAQIMTRNTKDANVEGEVKASTPEENYTAKAPNTDPEVINSESPGQKMLFNLNNSIYYLEKTDLGYEFFQEGISEPVASLVAAGSEDVYLYSSTKQCGVAYFGKEGNLVVEMVEEGKAAPTSRMYLRIDQ